MLEELIGRLNIIAYKKISQLSVVRPQEFFIKFLYIQCDNNKFIFIIRKEDLDDLFNLSILLFEDYLKEKNIDYLNNKVAPISSLLRWRLFFYDEDLLNLYGEKKLLEKISKNFKKKPIEGIIYLKDNNFKYNDKKVEDILNKPLII